eukprot:555768-Prymnesium_polylepis.1
MCARARCEVWRVRGGEDGGARLHASQLLGMREGGRLDLRLKLRDALVLGGHRVKVDAADL